jgi:regulator of protease activity HflC (stomatin/prohibitin superfamily)
MTDNGGATVQTGPPLDADAEAAHKLQLAELYADQAEAEVTAIEAKLAGWKQTLADKKAEAKRLRAEVKEARG